MVKTIKEITIALKEAQQYEEWMEEIQMDERAGVQKVWKQWTNRLEKEKNKRLEHESKVQFDASFLSSAEELLAGIDEAGRGPLAGPVVTAAVILPRNCEKFIGINDSKQLSKKAREEFASIIKEHALAYSIHFQSAESIDALNIYEATRQSMKKSVESLKITPDFCIVDAMKLPIDIPQSSIIKGDAKSLSIAAASILAKHARDEYMEQLHVKFPVYGFDQNAGYGTKQHLTALEEFGYIEEHRKSFEPIKSMVEAKGRALV
ncbi:ribonuclease HII [Ureibacillus sinduriensis]|uniref:Ribonuclease HII n=1 Tax=Ureibacillus sinduriensis BLB-1 = JCM 15800 TaxID=1384057 RepID=A0A0A3HMV6_9BACL|nr:ribonuclease HII [Ureibacillus sinduriensis]KGR73876.1 ribonuclease HII [Ureibacillus sinduriensis BLB-1 = JCM 15800]